jgi:NAD(P)-dependent dehydrogenase (short-subunit alcohol dehydrogenase family)
MEIKNSVALVTGANRGLGKASRRPCSRLEPPASTQARHPGLITLSDRRVVPVSVDVTQENSVLAAAENCGVVAPAY